MSEFKEFYYGKQLRDYLLQFMAIFAGMQVQVGKTGSIESRLIQVPIKNGNSDRIAAFIKSEFTQNKPIRLPLFSAHLNSVRLSPNLRKGIGQNRRNTHMPTGGLFPDDIKTTSQYMPVPYMATFELGIWASNQDQHYQLLEQILMLFDPILVIQKNDDPFDWSRITSVELVDISQDQNLPTTDRRIIQSTLMFDIPIYISAPAQVHAKFVQDIFIRIGAVSQAANNSQDIIADLDAQGITYDPLFSLDDVEL